MQRGLYALICAALAAPAMAQEKPPATMAQPPMQDALGQMVIEGAQREANLRAQVIELQRQLAEAKAKPPPAPAPTEGKTP